MKPYIDMNIKEREETKDKFEKDFFKLINNAVFGKTMENVRKHRHIKLVTTDRRSFRTYYHTSKYFSESLMAIEMKKTKVKINKLVYRGMSILDISKTLMYEYWCYCIKPNMVTEQNYATWILIALLFILSLKISTKTLLMIFTCGLIHLTMMRMVKDRFQ